MLRTAFVSLLVVLLLPTAANTAETQLEREFQSVLDDVHQAGVPAVSALVSWEGHTWMGVSGSAPDPAARFRLASITKLFGFGVDANALVRELYKSYDNRDAQSK